MEFIERFKISELNPADYNPRRIDEESFKLLRESLNRFGVIKPVLLNKNGTLIAGHQRTKALLANGKKFVPAIRINQLVLKDEARLNLFHNSIETSKSEVTISGDLAAGYQYIEPNRFEYERNGNPTIVKEICRLIVKYGTWGSLIVAPSGAVLYNSDYAVATKLVRQKVLVYVSRAPEAEEIQPFLKREYGVYNYDTINIKNTSQTKCQMHRLRDGEKGKQNTSTCYETVVIPQIRPEQRGIDFGEGFGDYRRMLAGKGYNIVGYEPFFRGAENSSNLTMPKIHAAMKRVEEEITKNGLFDYVVLDSVLNSVTSVEFEHFVLLTCSALLGNDGTFYTATRKQEGAVKFHKYRATQKGRDIEFLDADKLSYTFRDGLWTAQKFNTDESLKITLSRYFHEVHVLPQHVKRKNQLRAQCRKPKAFSRADYLAALEEEFNPVYADRRYAKHAKLTAEIMLELERNDRIL